MAIAQPLLAGTWVRSLLYGVQPFDTWSTSGTLVMLIAVGIRNAVAPAIRAIRVDLAATLRQE